MHIAQHSLKCFTYGVPVRRYASEESDAKADKIKELKRKFKRISLIRPFYDKLKTDQMKKFKNPIDFTCDIN